MIKAIIFDADGMIVHGERFSSRLAKEYGISTDVTLPFFKNEFQLCVIGKADLKEELSKNLKNWNWKGTTEELLNFWFSDKYNIIEARFELEIQKMRDKGIKCYLATNNEKHRTDNLVNERGMGKLFDGIFSSGYLGKKKPEADFFSYVIENLQGISKEDIVFWDDDMENVDGARLFGLKAEVYTNFEDFKKKVDSY